ncbi:MULTISPECIES: TetR/AcrR family transcriptional regulator [unclassified Streptomyces]|uniref:TetR/AcrR family transcriptional regulator n=1 Tax=Streptomyces evansiae TaxID=3075535 RepID=A0ABU2QZZ8_9ACTN|nr:MULTISPECIES: TetR/AcrR family transcriptional regulator [unclassified Streptomyces]MDT0409546.1 TetR/AcrR family transcriptional regulator [Streptomyces sp. DSM 41979]MDT0420184.1 TetR/AcrR family transcriptional regulator [Streptomyces sp. DSM 41859]MYQ57621.1 TetR family transcriptional regulator [Streptomyces sp. SID4926]MYR29949.1 TetR family transcriptional regulator [Streptomyces sp. SID4945]NJA58790.1 TetR/AcrR family transcriptional regulator [Streptomyces sp. NEAU-H3]
MGHREDLLEGAKFCLLEKGFAATTARDIVRESGANLASIGYHYGSKDALLGRAYVALVEEMDLRPPEGAPGADAPPGTLAHFRATWEAVLASFPAQRAVWRLSFEMVLFGDRWPAARDVLIASQPAGRAGLLAAFTGLDEDALPPELVETEGRFHLTLLNGLILQWLFDPESATTAERLTEGVRSFLARVWEYGED